MARPRRRTKTVIAILALVGAAASVGLLRAQVAPRGEAQSPPMGTAKGQQYSRLLIRNVMMVSGRGTPAEGPVDVVVEGDRIVDIVPVRAESVGASGPSSKRPAADRVIDASGMYLLPGLVDMHAHLRGGTAVGVGDRGLEYLYRLLLGHGVTTLRDPGTGSEAQLKLMAEQRRLSEANQIVAPRLVLYKTWPGFTYGSDESYTPSGVASIVRRFKEEGADGIKVISKPAWYPDVLAAICAEARKNGMGVAIDAKVSESNAVTATNAGVTTIEHWFGIPDAALPGTQNFPPDYNNSEDLRFRYAAPLWAEADRYPEKILEVLDLMIKKGVVWDPTMVVYETNRDFSRAYIRPWRERYAHPLLLASWEQKPGNPFAYQGDWTTADEVAWKQNYQIWMKYIHEFAKRGGKLTTGTDPGYMQNLWGFAFIRELELFQEAGLHPLDVIKIATTNGTQALGLKDLSGIRIGNIADLIVVDGNPLANFKVMYGTGYDRYSADGKKEHRGGVRWTIKGGVVFDAPALLREVEWYVAHAKAGRTSTSNQ